MEEEFGKIRKALEELESENPEMRSNAAIKLRNYNNSESIFYLIRTIKEDEYPLTRISAIQSFTWLNDKSQIKVLLDSALNDPDKLVRLTAIESLATFKEDVAIDTLMKIVNRSDDKELIKAASLAIQIIQGLTPDWSMDWTNA